MLDLASLASVRDFATRLVQDLSYDLCVLTGD